MVRIKQLQPRQHIMTETIGKGEKPSISTKQLKIITQDLKAIKKTRLTRQLNNVGMTQHMEGTIAILLRTYTNQGVIPLEIFDQNLLTERFYGASHKYISPLDERLKTLIYQNIIDKFGIALGRSDFLNGENIVRFSASLKKHYLRHKRYLNNYSNMMFRSDVNQIGRVVPKDVYTSSKVKIFRDNTSIDELYKWISSGYYVKIYSVSPVVQDAVNDFENTVDSPSIITGFGSLTYCKISPTLVADNHWLVGTEQHFTTVDVHYETRPTANFKYSLMLCEVTYYTQRDSRQVYAVIGVDSKNSHVKPGTTIRVGKQKIRYRNKSKLEIVQNVEGFRSTLYSLLAVISPLTVTHFPVDEDVIYKICVIREVVDTKAYLGELANINVLSQPLEGITKYSFIAPKANMKTSLISLLKDNLTGTFFEDSDDYGKFLTWLHTSFSESFPPSGDILFSEEGIINAADAFYETSVDFRASLPSYFNSVVEQLLRDHQREQALSNHELLHYGRVFLYQHIQALYLRYIQHPVLNQKFFEDGIIRHCRRYNFSKFVGFYHTIEDVAKRRIASVTYQFQTVGNSYQALLQRSNRFSENPIAETAELLLQDLYLHTGSGLTETLTPGHVLRLFHLMPVINEDFGLSLVNTSP